MTKLLSSEQVSSAVTITGTCSSSPSAGAEELPESKTGTCKPTVSKGGTVHSGDASANVRSGG
jgi:hypothetical protein